MAENSPSPGLDSAIAAFAARCASSSPEPAAAFLARHAALREWLEPMLANEVGSAAVAAPPAIGRRLGPWHLLAEVGRGGMGVVYAACRDGSNEVAALKVLPGHLALHGSTVARFEREGGVGQRLDHPGIVRVRAAGEVNGTRWLAMDFVRGAPLDRVIDALRGRRPQELDGSDLGAAVQGALLLPPGELPPAAVPGAFASGYVAGVVRIALQLAEALGHAHAAGVTHRDVKPSNVLVRADGTAVLTDLGLARHRGTKAVTMTGDFAGTPHYSSPEQAMARRVDVDHRTDLFSLGGTLYELLTLQRPFDGATTQEVFARILTKEPASPQKLHAGLPDDLVTVVLHLLEKDPDRRYRDAASLATDLRAFLAYRPVAARRPSRPTRLLRWIRRQPMKAALGAVLAVAVPAVCGLSWYAAVAARAVAAVETSRRQQEVEAGLARSSMFFGGREAEQAKSVFALAPDNIEAMAGMALALSLEKDYPAALEFLAQRAAVAPSSPELERVRCWLLENSDRHEEAAALAERLGPPRTPLEMFLEAKLRICGPRVGDPVARQGAIELLERALLCSQSPRLSWYATLTCLAGTCRDRRRVEACTLAMKCLWPDFPETWYAEFNAWRGLDPERALVAITKAIDLAPSPAIWLDDLARAQSLVGKKKEALVTWRKVLAAKPRNASAAALIASEDPDPAVATQGVRAVITRDPDCGDAHYILGFLLRMEPAAAEPEFRRATELMPSNSAAWTNLGVMLAALGRAAEAATAWRRALECDPVCESAHQALMFILEGASDAAGAAEERKRWNEARRVAGSAALQVPR